MRSGEDAVCRYGGEEFLVVLAHASPDLAWTIAQRIRSSVEALAIVNPGIDPTTRGKFDYVGFKGGSEPGVITLAYLVKRKDGRWLAVVGAWHRGDAGVEEAKFVQLMTRALALVSDAKLPD